jgi:hypothetical protein
MFLVRTWLIWCIIALVCNTHIPQFFIFHKRIGTMFFFFFSVCNEGCRLTLKDINLWHLIWKVPTYLPTYLPLLLHEPYLLTYLQFSVSRWARARARTEPNLSRQKLHQIFLRSITFQKFLGIRALCWTHTSQGALIPRTSRLWILYLTH